MCADAPRPNGDFAKGLRGRQTSSHRPKPSGPTRPFLQPTGMLLCATSCQNWSVKKKRPLSVVCQTIHWQGYALMLPILRETIWKRMGCLARWFLDTALHWLNSRSMSETLQHSSPANEVFRKVNFSIDQAAPQSTAHPAQRPVPSPVTVPCRYRMHWWMWFWMYTMMTLNPLAPEFFPVPTSIAHESIHHNIEDENRGGEGRGMPVSASEAVSHEMTRMLQQCCSELHGLEQHGGHGGHTTVRKRSFARACRRALRTGYTTYRGTLMTPTDFPDYLTKQISKELEGKPDRPTVREKQGFKPTKKSRLRIFLWNPGGLSTSRFQELLLWLNANKVDLAIIPETRWSLETDWSTVAPDGSRWHCVRTGRPGHSGGVMILLSASTCRAQDLHWQVVCQGRLLHVRISAGSRATDVLGFYQYVHRDENRVPRQQLLKQLKDYLVHLPKRNTLILAGDFNTSMTTLPGFVASSTFQWKGGRTQGAQHSDASDLMQMLQQHDLLPSTPGMVLMVRPLLDRNMLVELTFCSLDVTLLIMRPNRYDRSLTSPCCRLRDMFHF